MKKIISILIIFAGISFASAGVCVDISQNLSKGSENSSVLALQNFLFQKGLLKATPNGYFGPATGTALKSYQKNVGLSQVGNTGPSTRTAIKKETCSVSSTPPSSIISPVACTQEAKLCPDGSYVSRTKADCSFASCSPLIVPIATLPVIDSIDKATFIAKGTMTAPLVIHGNNFSTSGNSVLLKLQGTSKVYTIATSTISTATGTVITINSGFTNMLIPCGDGCEEFLPANNYDVVVKNSRGESNKGYISINSIISSSSSGSQNIAIVQKIKQARLGTITFSSSAPVSLESLAFTFTGSPFDTSKLTNITLKDEITGESIGGGPTFDLKHFYLQENQSKIYDVYADINSVFSGLLSINTILSVKDFIGKNIIKMNLPEFIVTISG